MRMFMMKAGLATLCLAAAIPAAMANPVIQVSPGVIDYGQIARASDGTRALTVTNTGFGPLIISRILSSCGCIKVQGGTMQPIGPGQRIDVRVHYDTRRVGPFSKTITIISNAMNAPHSRVKVKGHVSQ